MSESLERGWLEAARATGDRAACGSLVTRFGPMVLGTCRRFLGDEATAGEAFEATFLVLLRRGDRLGPGTDLAPWLHRVACRVATRARGGRGPAAIRGRGFDLKPLLDVAIDGLWFGRSTLVARDLMGLTREEAAERLGCSRRDVDRRLGLARDAIDARLSRAAKKALRSGRAAAVGLLWIEDPNEVEIPAVLNEAVADAAARLAGDRKRGGQGSAVVIELASRVAAGLAFSRLRRIGLATMVLATLGVWASYAALHSSDAPDPAAGGTKAATSAASKVANRVPAPPVLHSTDADDAPTPAR